MAQTAQAIYPVCECLKKGYLEKGYFEELKCECEGILSNFWGDELKKSPSIEIVADTHWDELLAESKFLVCESRLQQWGYGIAKKSGYDQALGELLFFIHGLNHFFGYEKNPNFCTLDTSKRIPHDYEMHVATVDAAVNVPTEWLLDLMNKDGYEVIRAWYSEWKSDADPVIKRRAEISEGLFEEFRRMEKEEFLKFVKNYKSK